MSNLVCKQRREMDIIYYFGYPVRPFRFTAPKTLNYLAFQSLDFERT
jgi:hypothetical protein